MKKRLISAMLSISLAIAAFGGFSVTAGADGLFGTARQMEELNRGLIAIKTTADARGQAANGVYLSWRLLGDESLSNQAFDIYKNGKLLKTTGVHDATNYTDSAGTAADAYKVVKQGAGAAEVAAEPETTPWPNHYTARGDEVGKGNSEKQSVGYIDIPIERPDPVKRMGDGKLSYYYTYDKEHEGGANDASVGDLDGDGDYEIVLKWDPTDSKDSAGADFTGNVYIDAYEIDPNNDGYMWRIDLGPNVTAGAHYTQFMVYDFDGDGKAEVAMKTAPGSKDGTGKYVSEAGDTDAIRKVDNTAQFIGTSGRQKGKNPFTQFLTIFDGETGEALYTTEYIPYEGQGRWGDKEGKEYNRSERYLAGVAYLDGIKPSVIMCRGYYHNAVIRAYNWDGEKLTQVWECNGNKSADNSIYGQGNHNLSVSDIDNDGKDEIVYGSVSIDHDGKAIGNTKLGHGDAMHVNDFNNDGTQEVFSVKEDKVGYAQNAAHFRIASTGKTLWGKGAGGDTGRGVMANIDDDYAKSNANGLALSWTSSHDNAFDLKGNEIGVKPTQGSKTMTNSLVFWDGDLGRELLDGNLIAKYHVDSTVEGGAYTKRFYGASDGYTLVGGASNNYSKDNASLSADIWGDWREEIILPINKNNPNAQAALRIYTSAMPTDYRLTTLMHDCQYRCAVAWQNTAYNQPPHTSYYIGSAALAKDSSGNTLNYLAPAVPFTKVTYSTAEKISVTGINISESSVRVEKGKTVSLSASILPENATRKAIAWTTSDSNIAVVKNGIVSGIAPGKATITATTRDGGHTAFCEVEVWSIPVTGVTMTSSEISVGVGRTKQLGASVVPANASDASLTWSSSNSAVAEVDGYGKITAHMLGDVDITAKSTDGNYSVKCSVHVVPLVSTDVTGEDVFVTSSEPVSGTTFTGTATSASLNQNSKESMEFHRSFIPYSDNIATLKFNFVTGGVANINGNKGYDENGKVINNWNWDGHEYSMGVSLLDNAGENILTLEQPYASSAGKMTSRTGVDASANFESDWTTVVDRIGNIQGSAKRWMVTFEFDYDRDICTATIAAGVESGGVWKEGEGKYTKSFSMGGANFETLSVYTRYEGTENLIATPAISGVSYTRSAPVNGKTEILYEKGTAQKPWSASDIADWKQTGKTLEVDTANGGLVFNTEGNPAFSASKTFNVSSDALVTYDIDWYFGGSTARDSNYEYVQIGNKLRIGWLFGYNISVSTDGGATWNDNDNDGTSDALFHGNNETYTKNINVVIDTSTNTIQSFEFDGTKIEAYTGYKLTDADIGSVSFGFVRGGSHNGYTMHSGLNSITVSQFVEEAEEQPTTPPPATASPSPVPTADPTKVVTAELDGEMNENGEMTVLVTNNTGAAVKVAVAVASYNDDGTLAAVSFETKDIAKDASAVQVTAAAPNTVTSDIRGFIWDVTGTMMKNVHSVITPAKTSASAAALTADTEKSAISPSPDTEE